MVKRPNFKVRRLFLLIILSSVVLLNIVLSKDFSFLAQKSSIDTNDNLKYQEKIHKLPIKGRSPKNNYTRDQFGKGWQKINGCSVREVILARDLTNTKINDKCQVISGLLIDPYTNKHIPFQRGKNTSALVQIDHVVALSDAWQKGAQNLDLNQRIELANDPLNLLAVDGKANQQKSDGDLATWLPPNKSFRCQYAKRQIDIKIKYNLWVTLAEKESMQKIINNC